MIGNDLTKVLIITYFWPLINRKELALWNAGAGYFIFTKS